MINESDDLKLITEFLKNKNKDSSDGLKKSMPKLERPLGFDFENGIKSRSRVVDLAEVFTPKWVVDDMLDELPTDLFEDPKSRFLEPSCGNGNFIIEILARKFEYIASETPKSKRDFAIFVALASIYGIDISEQNILEARLRIWTLVETFLNKYFKEYSTDLQLQRAFRYLIDSNIVVGDTLKGGEEIEIIEFTYPNENLVTRRIFTFLELQELNGSMMMFPRPTKILSTVHFKEVADVD